MSSDNPLAATVEDYESGDESTVRPPLKLSKPSNKPPNVSTSPPVTALVPDAASDSGYSSRTAATLGSLDSAGKSVRVPLQSKSGSPSNSQSSRTNGKPERRKDSQSSTHPPSSRPSSRTTARPSSRPTPSSRRCSEPNCAECVAMYRNSRRSPLESPWNLEYPSIAPLPAPQSPHASAPPNPYPQYGTYQASGVPVVAVPQPRQRSFSQSRVQRPRSFHPSPSPEGYWIPVNPAPRYEHGPPPAPSAYANPHYPMNPYTSYSQIPASTMASYNLGPSPISYPSSTSTPVSAHPHARPALPHSATDTTARRRTPRPVSMYDTSFTGLFDQSMQNGTAIVPRPVSRSRQPYEPYAGEVVDRQRMPPPPLPRPESRRPSQGRQDSSHYLRDRYDYSESSDSSGTSPHTSTRERRPYSRSERRSSQSNPHQHSAGSSLPFKEQLEQNRGRKSSHPTYVARADLKDGEPDHAQNRSIRRARTTSRPTRNGTESSARENSLSRHISQSSRRSDPVEEYSTGRGTNTPDGFKIEVDRQGMNLNLNGQRISVMPKEGGMAELIIGSQRHETVKYIESSS